MPKNILKIRCVREHERGLLKGQREGGLKMSVAASNGGKREDSLMINVMAKLKIYFYPQNKKATEMRRKSSYGLCCAKRVGV